MLFFDVRQPTRVAGATGRLQVVVFLAASLWISAFRASGTDGVSFRLFFGNDHDKFVYCSVQLAREACLDAAIRQASFFGENAFGVVPFGQGYGIRGNHRISKRCCAKFSTTMRILFLGSAGGMSGLLLIMGMQSLRDFLGNWQVKPLHTFRQGFRRTWIVRATSDPAENIIVHDFGIAVIKDVVQKQCSMQSKRYQAPRVKPRSQFVRSSGAETPKSWAGIVAGDAAASQKNVQHRSAGDVSVRGAAVSRASVPVVAAVSALAQPQHFVPTSPADFSNLMSVAIEAALKPMKE